MQKEEIGRLGEELAAKNLLNKGYLILARNHKEKFNEIDIIARDPDETLIFCEVKTLADSPSINRGTGGGFMPEDNLSHFKLKKLIRGIRIFLAKYPELVIEEKGWQIDLIAITLKNLGERQRSGTLRHYKNI